MMKASGIATALSLLALASSCALAQDYPARPVKIIVPYAPGGQPDTATRVLAQQFSSQLGQPFVIENMPGAGGVAAVNALLKANADGYTLLSIDQGHWAINPALDPKLPYDPERDFTPVGLYGQSSGLFLAVNDSVPSRTLRELIALAKSKPGALSYASAGIGSTHHLIMEDFKAGTGSLNILHVPYKGAAQAVPALVGGQVNIAVASLGGLQSYAKDGRVRILAVATQARSALAPDVPTVSEATGIAEFDYSGGSAFVARTGTAKAVIDRLQTALAAAQKVPEVAARFATVGMEPSPDISPGYLAERMRKDRVKYLRIVKSAGITAQ